MNRKRSNPDFLNGVPELLILQLLTSQPMYGYQIVQMIKDRSGEVLEFGEGCIYPTLHRLEADGLLSGRREVVGGRSRVVYRLTQKGATRLKSSTREWRQIASAIQTLLDDRGNGHDALPALA